MEVRDTGGQENMVNMEETDQNDADASASVNIVDHIPLMIKPNASTRDLRSGTTVTIEEDDGLPDFTPDNDQIPGPRVDNVGTKSVLQFFLLFWTYMIIDKSSKIQTLLQVSLKTLGGDHNRDRSCVVSLVLYCTWAC